MSIKIIRTLEADASGCYPGTMNLKQPILEKIGGVELLALAERFGTPLYLYDQMILQARVGELKQLGSTIRYAMKACSNLAMLALVREMGLVVDCVSTGEIQRALKAGFSPKGTDGIVPGLVYTCDLFDRESLEVVLENEIAINAGSIDMLHQYGPRAKRKDITVRINPGFGHGHSNKTNTGGPSSKHGIWLEDIAELKRVAASYDLRITGLHLHIGSGTDFEHLQEVCGAMKELAREFSDLEMISAGGGLPIPYRVNQERIDLARYGELWRNTLAEISAECGRELRLEFEPGRYVVAECGFLLSEVRAIKREGENTFVLVDAGFNNLVRPAMYGSFHYMSVCPAEGGARATKPVCVAGPLCESGDVFTQLEGGVVELRELPLPKIGDLLLIHDTGAYGASMGSNYNSKPHAAEVLISGGEAKLIRRRQNLETLLADEII